LVTLASNFGIISPYSIIFNWEAIKDKFEIWRFLTCFCYAGAFEFPTLVTIYMLLNFSKQYESGGPFNTGAGGGTADYAFMLMIGFIVIVAGKPLTDLVWPTGVVFTKNLVYFVVYIWSKRHPEAQSNIWGIPIKGAMLPFAYLGLSIFIGAPYRDMVHGYAMGHIYYFMVEVVPNVYGRDILVTPTFLIDRFGVGEYRPAGAPVAPDAAAAAAPRAHQWGAAGNRLGGQGAPAAAPPPGGGARGNVAGLGQAPRAAPAAPAGHTWGTGGQRLGGT
jgi:hypothetical protein